MKKNNDAFSNHSIRVPFFMPKITDADRKAINEALKSTLLTDGPKLREFESKFAKYTGAKYAVGVSNATSALHLVLKSLNIGSGDEVIVPDLTFVATANAILLTGATPVLADVDDDMNISVESIKDSMTRKTRAILPVHLTGQVCKIKEIMKLAQDSNLSVIEDCAHAIGSKLDGTHVGTFGDAGCFSFYPTKNITTIEGGMIITDSKKIAQYAGAARNHGITKSLLQRYSHGRPWEYDVVEPGYNYRLDEVRSSLGLSQLGMLTKWNLLRKKAFEYYNKKLSKTEGLITPTVIKNTQHSYHLYILRIQEKFRLSRDEVFKKLLAAGIRTSVHYKPLHEFTIFKKKAKCMVDLKNTKKIYREIISLPLFPHITRLEQNRVIDFLSR